MGAGHFSRLFGLPAVGVGAGVGVTVEAGEVRKHGVEDAGVSWSGGLHVEVDRASAFIHYCGPFENSCEDGLSILSLK